MKRLVLGDDFACAEVVCVDDAMFITVVREGREVDVECTRADMHMLRDMLDEVLEEGSE